MTELENALYCEKYNRMSYEDKLRREKKSAYNTLKNMVNMLKEHRRENRDLSIPWREEPSRTIQDRYGIEYQSEFNDLWVVIERLCNGQYIFKK